MRILTLDSAFTDATIPLLNKLEDYEAQITALSPRAWWDASNAAYRTDASGKCAQLTDRSGGGFHLVQATGVNQPAVTANYWGALNGVSRDALIFDGATDLFMQTAGNVFDSTNVWTEAMFIRSASTALAVPLGNGTQNWGYFQGPTNIQFPNTSGVPVATPTAGTNLALIGTTNYPGSGQMTATIDVNGTAATLAMANAAVGTNKAILGCTQASHVFKWNGAVAEAIIFKADLSGNAPAMAMLKAYFAMKYR
ncbi:hypothetical protein QH494_06165 [Sphingomonas sp. AR_OL41]|uniref:hypothetical protein n=1 Tax=Sphingomonas sp. AR_OL41 TaxID=3042729 RepID=UPI00247FCCCE|nr:hypothetical protein [Sphingomonas sp. AR_OL41]MDH7971763.1 hypothetical protein [Sphingomonas sp. AR_OL41]